MAVAGKLALHEATYVPSSNESEQLAVVRDFITERDLGGKGSRPLICWASPAQR